MAGTTTKTAAKRTPAKRAAATVPVAPTAQPAPTPLPAGQEIPEELRGFYDQVEEIAADTADVSLDMVSKTDAEREKTQKREKLFSIDGVDYTIPIEFGPRLSLTFIDAISSGASEDVALGRTLRAAMGTVAWNALRDFEDLTAPQLKKILGITMEKVMGAVEAAKGKS